ncbi:MAG: DUF2141 domain-containing protein [Flavobacteriales bacterium]|nr:DUF2141 domain-containing protein [Flavobacteriales bacterium]
MVFAIFILWGFRSNSTHTLTVQITRIRHQRGTVEIGLYEKENCFPKVGKQCKKGRVKVQGNTVTHRFTGLKNGSYAIAVYHDENNDKSCNKNIFGVPTEAYAFSNNVRPFLSAPEFKSCRFWITDDKTISIRMVY